MSEPGRAAGAAAHVRLGSDAACARLVRVDVPLRLRAPVVTVRPCGARTPNVGPISLVLGIVERVTIVFFDAYLKHHAGALRRIVSLGSVPGTASLLAEP